MTGDLSDMAEGLADAGTGAAAASAIERERGATDATGHAGGGACLNCGTALVGPHCHACGQRAHVHRTLAAFFHDLLHGVLHFEGKTWRTIPLLVWKPGQLTREYIDGRRARYVSPIALFLFVVFLSYALFNALGGGSPAVDGTAEARARLETTAATIERLETRRDAAEPARRAEIDAEIADLRSEEETLRTVLGAIGGKPRGGTTEELIPKNTELGRIVEHVSENPQLAIYKAQTSAYKFSWMLIPISVPFVWLLFPFSRRFRGYDHTVFVTYSIAFMIALVAVASLLIYAGSGAAGVLVLLYAPFHLYRQLRGTYALGRFGALWRMLALSLFAWTAIALFAAVIFWMAGS
ncbi:DUF3667 domain-containing protein [Tsuneonella sp. YG55]|uniref:DUF3667 domain-containing protein n=1 Tax=Tsuneonella litorea TaxID=2976475 RepID=A0A9X3A837_9SPHN|nr:DUF3667 domain-containing protein [Tsuneonella litorea]MCT2557460.1 DUF3667 domain-containing protein [Tsuneonella litorea]